MADVFISYAREDQSTAEAIAKALALEGLEGWHVWWDHSLKPGERFRQVIERELDAARCVLVLWSKHSVRSRFVLDEAERAQDRGVLIPLLIDKDIDTSDIPLGFGVLHTADLTDWTEGAAHPGYDRLVETVASRIAAAEPRASAEAGPNHRDGQAVKRKELAGSQKADRRRQLILLSSPFAFGINLLLLLWFSKRLWGDPISFWAWIDHLKEGIAIVAFPGAGLAWYIRRYWRLQRAEAGRQPLALFLDRRGHVRTWIVFAAWACLPVLAIAWRLVPPAVSIVPVSMTGSMTEFEQLFRYYELGESTSAYVPQTSCYFRVATRVGRYNPDSTYRLIIGVRASDRAQVRDHPDTLAVKIESIHYNSPRDLDGNATRLHAEAKIEILDTRATLRRTDHLGVIYQYKKDTPFPEGVELYAEFGSRRQQELHSDKKRLQVNWKECR